MSRKPGPLVLSEAESQQLAHIVERGSDWRARQRARTLLLLHSGEPMNCGRRAVFGLPEPADQTSGQAS